MSEPVSPSSPGPDSPQDGTARPSGRVRKETMLQIKDVTKQFDGIVAVDDVSLELPRDEIFALLGASGSGKSTLLRILAGFEKPVSGRIILGGQDITDLPPL